MLRVHTVGGPREVAPGESEVVDLEITLPDKLEPRHPLQRLRPALHHRPHVPHRAGPGPVGRSGRTDAETRPNPFTRHVREVGADAEVRPEHAEKPEHLENPEKEPPMTMPYSPYAPVRPVRGAGTVLDGAPHPDPVPVLRPGRHAHTPELHGRVLVLHGRVHVFHVAMDGCGGRDGPGGRNRGCRTGDEADRAAGGRPSRGPLVRLGPSATGGHAHPRPPARPRAQGRAVGAGATTRATTRATATAMVTDTITAVVAVMGTRPDADRAGPTTATASAASATISIWSSTPGSASGG